MLCDFCCFLTQLPMEAGIEKICTGKIAEAFGVNRKNLPQFWGRFGNDLRKT